MESIKIEGTVRSIGEVIEKGNFKKQDIVIETDGQYKQIFAVELFKEKIELADFLTPGDEIVAHCNLRGREWINNEGEAKHFLSLNCWKIDK